MQDKAIQLDQFGQPFFFRLPDGRRDKRTWQGLCFSILVAMAIGFYASTQFINLVDYGSNTIMVSTKDSYFDMEYEFGTQDGFMIAFGLTTYDDDYEVTEDPQYGQLKAYYKSWGEDGQPGIVWTEVPSSPCTENQLKEGNLFYPVHKNSAFDLMAYHKKFKCVDKEQLTVHGDYNSATAQAFVI